MPIKDKEKNTTYKREYARKYYANPANVTHRRELSRQRYRNPNNWFAKHPEKRLLKAIQNRCIKKRWKCEVTAEDLLPLPTHCSYLGIKLDYRVGCGRTGNSPSVDRIDNAQRYVKGNLEVISSQANTMKSKATVEELQLFAKRVLQRWP